MTRLLTLPARAMRALRDVTRREDGTASLDFVIIVPVFIFLFVSSFEVSIILIRQMMLERGVDLAVRDLRLGTWPNINTAGLKTAICDNTAGFISDCENQIMLELVSVPKNGWTLPDPGATCVDRSANVQPVTSFDAGTENQMMIIRACLLVDPFFPGTRMALDLEKTEGSGIELVATSGFVNEPGTGT